MNKLTYSILAGALFLSACGVGVDSDPNWASSSDETGSSASASIIVIKANVSVPATTSASISKDFNLSKAVSDVPASGYQAVCENFITGEIVGTSTIASDGSVEIAGDEAKMADPDDATRTRLVCKAIPQDGSLTDEGVVQKYIESAITPDISVIDALAINITETFSVQMIRAQLGVETSANTSGARNAISTGFMPGCLQAFMNATLASSGVVEANMSGAFGALKAGFECIMASGSKLGYASFPEMFRAMAKGELTDSVINQMGDAFASNNCGAVDAATIKLKIKQARDAMLAVRQSAATQIAGDAVTCAKVTTDANEMSARKEALKSTDPAKLTDYETYKTGDGADLEKMMEVARTNNDYSAFDSTRAKVMWGAIETGDYKSMTSDSIKTMMDMVKTADLASVTDYKNLGATLGGVWITYKDDATYMNALKTDSAKYASYFVSNSGTTAATVTNGFGVIYNTLETNSSSIESCKSQYGGTYNSSCFSGYTLGDITGVLSVVSTTSAIGGVVKGTFNKGLSSDSVTAGAFTVKKTSDDSPVSGTVSVIDNKIAAFTSSDLVSNTQYTATLTTGIKDLSGANLAASYSWTFTIAGAPGTLDASFGTGGKVTTAIGTGNDSIRAMVILSDDKIIVAGMTNSGNDDFAIARYNTNGTLDTTFGTSGKTVTALTANTDFVFDMARQTDGKYVVVGRAATASTNWDSAVVRYNTDGTLDTSFSGDGIAVTAVSATSQDQSLSVAIQPDGKILASGTTRTPSTGTSNLGALLRYNTDGTLDTTFGTNGIVITPTGSGENTQIYGLAVLSDGKILGAGLSRNGTASQLNFLLIRYNTDGSLDTTFDSDGILTTDLDSSTKDYANNLLLQPDGKILVAGLANGNSAWTTGDFAVIRYNADGSFDTTFGTNGVVVTNAASGRHDYIGNIALQSDGKIVAAGYSMSSDFSDYDFIVARYNADGSLDTSFGTNGIINQTIGTGYEYAYDVAIQSDGKIVIGGTASPTVGNTDFAIVRYWP